MIALLHETADALGRVVLPGVGAYSATWMLTDEAPLSAVVGGLVALGAALCLLAGPPTHQPDGSS